ncbi:XrtA-associated ATPase [Temperatibacter marinus]|uniref:XrtA-associated ATPase n=1 Tax=Temperatibacter marinus TaxID=1456591 RepID=A0AA52H977_9PROT|nr:XrtA/PEP-CTERM system-associated ATPase [Temperatibacter marinus]WND02604.1 XrtA-associated ATPase [Temperatibacter marinus]
MYEDFYNLSGRPFQLTPDPRFYYSSRSHKKAMAYLTYGLSQGEGFIIVTGDIGTGKTTLVRHLFDTLDRNEFVAALIVSTQLSADDLLRTVAAAYGLDTQAEEKGELITRLERFLREQNSLGKRVLLVVDEAQNLSSAALEEMRMISNFQSGEDALLQSFLVGQPEFRTRIFNAPELEQLRQRVIATHHIDPMEPEEVADYIEHRLSLVGWDGDPEFDIEAVAEIYDYTQGVPRILNTLMSRILLYGSLEEVHEITGDVVRKVISEMAENQGAKGRVQSQQSGPTLTAKDDMAPLSQMEQERDTAKEEADHLRSKVNNLEEYIKSQEDSLKKLTEMVSKLSDKD